MPHGRAMPCAALLAPSRAHLRFPAISFAYESKEADIMLRPPRNSATDHLVDWNLIRWAYGQMGMIQTLAGFYSYFVVLREQLGLGLGQLYNLTRDEQFGEDLMWCDSDKCYFDDRSGSSCASLAAEGVLFESCATADESKSALAKAQTAFFVAIVMCQLANVLVCKTRKLSIFTKVRLTDRQTQRAPAAQAQSLAGAAHWQSWTLAAGRSLLCTVMPALSRVCSQHLCSFLPLLLRVCPTL